MKKILAAALFTLIVSSVCICVTASAGVIGAAHYSNIDTYINNYPVNAYYYEGRQLIMAEDLRDYGFNVIWNGDARTLDITPEYTTAAIHGSQGVCRHYYLQYKRAFNIVTSDIRVFLNGTQIPSYSIDGYMLIRLRDLESLGSVSYSPEENYSKAWIQGLPWAENAPVNIDYSKKAVIVLDAGHGKSSSLMSADEKAASGYSLNNGRWGEWRHWKTGSAYAECEGSGCNHDHECWYPIGNGDRSTEPDINLRNTLSAKKYLEELGYEVRLTRSTNDENPSFTKRVSYCYPACDMTARPDASCYVCLHSNAGGGRGSAYISAEGNYTQAWIDSGYVSDSNALGRIINNRIVSSTSMPKHGSGAINGQGYMILFNKCPVPAGYIEIGFFDSSADLAVLNSEYDAIGKAIAYGIDEYMNS